MTAIDGFPERCGIAACWPLKLGFRCLGRAKANMTEPVKTEPRPSGISLVFSAWHDPAARILNVDLLTVLIAILLPWSTTGVVIAVVLWIFALIPTLEARSFLRSLKRPIGALPIAFFAL